MSSARMNCTACLHCCNDRGSCFNGSCLCKVQFAGVACEEPNLSYLVSFGCIFFLLFVIATVQLVLCMLFDSRKSDRPCLKSAFRVTTQKLLYGIVLGAAGTRGIYFSIQEYIPAKWGDILFNLYYPALITAFSLLMCHWAESFQHSKLMNVSQHQYLNKYSAAFLVFNILVYGLWIAEVISTVFITSSLQVRKTNIFNIVFAFLMLLTLLGFVCVGIKLFLQQHNKKLIVNSKQQKHSLIGLVSQTLLQGLVVILLLYDMFSHLYHNDVTDNVAIGISIRVLEFGVALWFSCALWNIKKPDALWVLSPELVVRISRPQERQNNYGTISARPEDRCFICLDDDPKEDLIFPCKCRGELGVVHPSCLQKLCVTSLASSKCTDHPTCKVCNQKYKIETPSFYMIMSIPSVRRRLWIQGILLFIILALSLVIIYFASVRIRPAAAKFFVVSIVIVTDLIIFQIAGYHWWLYYKKIKAASIRIDGPRAVVIESKPVTNSAMMEERSVEERSLQDDTWSSVVDDGSETELITTPSPRSNLSPEDNMFCLDDCDTTDNSYLITKSSTTEQNNNYDSTSPVSVTVSVIVHSASSDLT